MRNSCRPDLSTEGHRGLELPEDTGLYLGRRLRRDMAFVQFRSSGRGVAGSAEALDDSVRQAGGAGGAPFWMSDGEGPEQGQ